MDDLPRITRRTAIAAPLILLANKPPNAPSLANDVATYVGFGEHRVGMPSERKTARWLEARLRKLGYQTRLDRFPVTTLLNPGGALQTVGTSFRAFPQWLPPAEALTKSLSAPLLAIDAPAGPASIRLIPKAIGFTPHWNEKLDALVAQAKEKGALALVMAIDIPSGDLFVLNQHNHRPLALPVALVAGNDLAQIGKAIGRPARLALKGRVAEVQGINVVGEKPGKGKRLVVSTPLTGWFSCGGERGPGIALWLKMAAMLATSDRPVTLLGTGSHEVGHFGMEHALAHGAPTPDDVALWLHFGASLGATRLDERYKFKTPQYLVGLADTEAMAKAHLSSSLPVYVPGTSTTQGEAGQVIGAGHQHFVGMSGMFPAFHTPQDLGQALDYARLEQIAIGSAALLRRIDSEADQG